MTVRCDRCGVSWEPALAEDATPNGGLRQYIICPSGHRFDVAYLPPKAVRLRAAMTRLRSYLKQREDIVVRRKVQAIQAEIGRLVVRGQGAGHG